MTSYLEGLTVRLATGMDRLSPSARASHAGYLQSSQQADGGFAGRAGGSDFYYTGFALRSLAILGELYGPVAERAGQFLRASRPERPSIVDVASLVFSAAALEMSAGIGVFADRAADWPAEAVERFRRDDGGYAKSDEGAASSTYHTFLALLCRQLAAAPASRPERVVEFLLSQRCEDGGFREIRVNKRSGTNPTAAAIGALRMLDALSDEIRADAVEFLADMQTDEGGLRANTRIPIADLLSTFTGSLSLLDLNSLEEIDIAAVLRYASSLQSPEGGFRGAAWDEARDVEYTFYGIGCLSLFGGQSP